MNLVSPITNSQNVTVLKKINSEKKTTVIYVTHDNDYASLAPRKIELEDGISKLF